MSSSPSNSTTTGEVDSISSAGRTAITLSLVVAGAVVLIVVAFLITKYCLKKKSISNSNISTETTHIESKVELASVENFLDELMKEKPVRFTPQNLSEFTNNYTIKLGSGGFGEVYKGRFPNGTQIAVKVLHKTLNKRAEEQFMAEVGTIGRTYHINLVKLYGFCFEDATKALVYEYMENGSLDKYLFDKTKNIPWVKLQEIAVGTAKGLRYLHEECQRKIIHYDIKPGNILLQDNLLPKVAEFGLAKLCDSENTHVAITGVRGTSGYAAPEMWMPFPVTHKCDVYSFGMLLFEILGRRKNLEFNNTESQEWFPRWVWKKSENGEFDNVVKLCGIENSDKDLAERMCKVALWCVQYLPQSRPTMSSVVKMLEGNEEIELPVNPFQYLDAYDPSEGLWNGNSRSISSEGTGSWSQTRPLVII